jgi:predicted Zn-dependent protease
MPMDIHFARSRRRFGGRARGRLVLAIVIALVGIISYYAKTEKNPVTGENQRIGMSVEQEKAMGLAAAPKMASDMGGVEDPAASAEAQFVAQVGKRIVQSSDASKSPYIGNFHFYLLKDPQVINAFALPGGQVFITRGLYEKLQNEAQLAGVLGHEIGHVIGRHSAEQMAKGQLGQLLATAVGVGASDSQGGGQGAYVAAQMANQMIMLKYGRGDESEADTFGCKFMAEAGYDPSEMLGVMKILEEASKGNRQPEFLASHPYPETRYEATKAFLAKNYPNGVPATLTKGKSL